jgi:hypothetical protein
MFLTPYQLSQCWVRLWNFYLLLLQSSQSCGPVSGYGRPTQFVNGEERSNARPVRETA